MSYLRNRSSNNTLYRITEYAIDAWHCLQFAVEFDPQKADLWRDQGLKILKQALPFHLALATLKNSEKEFRLQRLRGETMK